MRPGPSILLVEGWIDYKKDYAVPNSQLKQGGGQEYGSVMCTLFIIIIIIVMAKGEEHSVKGRHWGWSTVHRRNTTKALLTLLQAYSRTHHTGTVAAATAERGGRGRQNSVQYHVRR